MSAKPKRKKMLEFSIGEISGVDAPAQEHATVDIMLADMAKAGKLVAATDVQNGHQHAIRVGEGYSGASRVVTVRLLPAISENATGQHSHEIFRVGSAWQITTELGHSHSVHSAPIDAEIKRLDYPAESINAATDRGTLTMKNHPELQLAAQLGTGAFDHLGGPEIRKNVLRPIVAMTDPEARDAALAALRAGGSAPHAKPEQKLNGIEAQLAKALEGPDQSTAEAELEKLAEARADKMGISYARAYDFVLRSGRGKDLASAMQSHNRGSVNLIQHLSDMQRDGLNAKAIAAKKAA